MPNGFWKTNYDQRGQRNSLPQKEVRLPTKSENDIYGHYDRAPKFDLTKLMPKKYFEAKKTTTTNSTQKPVKAYSEAWY